MTWAADEHSNDALDQLATLIHQQEMSLLTGAGLSKRLGYPLWRELVTAMSVAVGGSKGVKAQTASSAQRVAQTVKELPPDAPQDLTWLAEYYAELLGKNAYVAFLKGVFGSGPKKDPSKDPCYRILLKLPFQNILTFNYDDTLLLAHQALCTMPPQKVDWANAEHVRSFLFRSRRPGAKRHFVHLHGSSTDSVVLRNTDYVQRYVISREGEERLFLLFSTHKLLFVGCSLGDAPVLSALQAVHCRLGTPEASHFAILPARPGINLELERRRLTTRFGISPLFYPEKHHELLQKLLEDLNGRVKATAVENQTVASDPRKSMTQKASAALREPWIPGPVRYADDPQKGRFGGRAQKSGRRLKATVSGSNNWYKIVVTVEALPGAPPLAGKVVFYIHDTFPQSVRHINVKDGVARMELGAYGAFTIGALADDGLTALELDMSKDPKNPKEFRDN